MSNISREVEDKVVSVAQKFCGNCDNLSPPSREFPRVWGYFFGSVCNLLGSPGMIERHEAGECGLAMVNGVSGTMTFEGFKPECEEVPV